MKFIIWLLSKIYIKKKAYALNEYRYYEKNNSSYVSFWKIESVIIEGISIYEDDIQYSLIDAKSLDVWGDVTPYVYLTKWGAARAFSKMKITPILK